MAHVLSLPAAEGRRFRPGVAPVAFLLALALPLVTDDAGVGNAAYCLVWTFGSIGLAAMWGHAGILSFGQTAFFGLAGYGWGVMTLNWGDSAASTWGALALSLALATLAAAALGYMIFYGRVTGVFIGIVTLSVTLVLETFMAQTAGPQWTIGEAPLNGYNGMSGMPPLTLPWPGGEPLVLEGTRFYYVVLALLAVVHALTRRLLASPFGLALAAIRENPRRAEMLGLDIRRHQFLVFVYGSMLGGLSGALYTIWGSYITPSSMGLTAAAMPVIWVAVAGRRSIGGAIVATAGLVWLSQALAVHGSQYALILMGAILLFVILSAPEGLLPWLGARLGRLLSRRDAPAVAREASR